MKRAVGLMLSVAFLFMLLMTAGCESQAQKEKIASLEQQVATLQTENASLKQQIENLTKENEALRAHVEELAKKPAPAAKKK